MAISELFYHFPAERMAGLHWIRPFAAKSAAKALKIIAADILHGRENSLVKRRRSEKEADALLRLFELCMSLR
ncbi:MAG: hypothetical protein NT030_07055 [Candidatus Saganbacteria bacterium]|nr:hypothetical protein [Candidatus Saganbacteria bacterium]